MKITLRSATIRDVSILTHWDSQPHVLHAKNLTEPDAGWNWLVELNRSPFWRKLLIGEVDGRPVASIQIIDPKEEDTHYWGDVPQNLKAIDIWIGEAEDLGRGYGTIFMQLALDMCFRDEAVQAVLLDPLQENVQARRFYERLGFRFVEHRMFDQDSCAVYRLDRLAWAAAAKTQPAVQGAGGEVNLFNDKTTVHV